MYKCPVCKETSCGDDYHTRTKYKKEVALGDRLKVVLLQVYDMFDCDNLQKYEVLALLAALVEKHVDERDEANN